MTHEEAIKNIEIIMPGLVKIFEDGVRYGADIEASFGDVPEDVGYQLIKE